MTGDNIKVGLTALLLAFLLSAYSAFADEPHIFTNSDLDKYRPVGNSLKEEPQSSSGSNGLQSQPAAAETDLSGQRHWCDMATKADARIKIAETALFMAVQHKGETSRRLMVGNRYDAVEADRAAQRNVEEAEAELGKAKEAKLDLEDEAHRSGIPPGWLRCQF